MVNSNAFRRGMLMSLAANGITPDDLLDYSHEKLGEFLLNPEDLVSGIGNTAKEIATWPFAGAVGAGVGLGLAGGAGAYYLTRDDYAQQAKDLKDKDRSDVLKREILLTKLRMQRHGHGAKHEEAVLDPKSIPRPLYKPQVDVSVRGGGLSV